MIYLIFLSLGMDTFGVSAALGMKGLPRSRWLTVGITFALFEGLMPAVGLLIGRRFVGPLGDAAGYLAAVILIALGVYEVLECRREAAGDDDDENDCAARIEGGRLLLTGLSVSLDELAIGFTLGMLGAPMAASLAYIGTQALAGAFLGLFIGERVGARLGERAELAAGSTLALLGVILLLGKVIRIG